jgi:septal ring factor EnvC (AmiA/AmiB activator)
LPVVNSPYEQALDESRQRGARLEGELAAVRDQLAASLAAEEQLRQELHASEVEVTRLEGELAHTQRETAERERAVLARVRQLETQLAESRRVQQVAEEERAAVIAALGRRARRRLVRPGLADEADGDHRGDAT